MQTPRKRVLYGEANYRALITRNGYYVDKTRYIRLLERYSSPVFLRPRRFGKSLLCTTLQYYYDVNYADQFEELFGRTDIGRNPTPSRNSYMVLHLDFSIVEPGRDIEKIEHNFNYICNSKLETMMALHSDHLEGCVFEPSENVTNNLSNTLDYIAARDLPPLYVIIDEYDNYANQLIVSRKDDLYRKLTADDSFLKTFFKALKEGRKNSTIAGVFVTGVLPITMDDLASGYNIADYLTLHEDYETMLGFTQAEVDCLLDQAYADHAIDPATREQVDNVIKDNYNGYHFVNPDGEALYNSTILMYFLQRLCELGKIPEFLTDMNLKTDISWVKRLTASNTEHTMELVDRLLIENRISYSRNLMKEKFNMSQFFEKTFYPISFYYLGMFTLQDRFHMRLPNLNMRAIFTEYFNELHKIDTATKYADMMSGFVTTPDLPKLFADYWELYVSQLPEAVFQKVNENFYRTTFYDLCRQFLSLDLAFTMEHSYASGRTDLEFIGKFDSKFAGLRYLMEFKYFSNAETAKRGIKIAEFSPPTADLEKLRDHDLECREKHSSEKVSTFLIYCFGNQGFFVHELTDG